MNFRDPFFVYFIRPVGMDGPIKIGLSSDPQKRMYQFESWAPFKLELMGAVRGSWRDEQFLHECLVESHSHGEWFHPTPAVRAAIAMVLHEGGFASVRDQMKPVANLRSIRNRATRARKAAPNSQGAVA